MDQALPSGRGEQLLQVLFDGRQSFALSRRSAESVRKEALFPPAPQPKAVAARLKPALAPTAPATQALYLPPATLPTIPCSIAMQYLASTRLTGNTQSPTASSPPAPLPKFACLQSVVSTDSLGTPPAEAGRTGSPARLHIRYHHCAFPCDHLLHRTPTPIPFPPAYPTQQPAPTKQRLL